MVTFKLVENGERYAAYSYFPDGKAENGAGTIVLDKGNSTIAITKLAPRDFSRTVSAAEQNQMRDSVNKMRKEENRPELTEDEWPSAAESFTSTFFADHVINEIWEAYVNGTILTAGTVVWY